MLSRYIPSDLVARERGTLRLIVARCLSSVRCNAGQFIASSPTLFPEEYVLEFEKCLDRTEPVPFQVIKNTIQRELGRPIEEVFLSVDPVPLASASVAQVHCAGATDLTIQPARMKYVLTNPAGQIHMLTTGMRCGLMSIPS